MNITVNQLTESVSTRLSMSESVEIIGDNYTKPYEKSPITKKKRKIIVDLTKKKRNKNRSKKNKNGSKKKKNKARKNKNNSADIMDIVMIENDEDEKSNQNNINQLNNDSFMNDNDLKRIFKRMGVNQKYPQIGASFKKS